MSTLPLCLSGQRGKTDLDTVSFELSSNTWLGSGLLTSSSLLLFHSTCGNFALFISVAKMYLGT